MLHNYATWDSLEASFNECTALIQLIQIQKFTEQLLLSSFIYMTKSFGLKIGKKRRNVWRASTYSLINAQVEKSDILHKHAPWCGRSLLKGSDLDQVLGVKMGKNVEKHLEGINELQYFIKALVEKSDVT